jgi:hypothetical protein
MTLIHKHVYVNREDGVITNKKPTDIIIIKTTRNAQDRNSKSRVITHYHEYRRNHYKQPEIDGISGKQQV